MWNWLTRVTFYKTQTQSVFFTLYTYSERGTRHGGSDGQREAQEGAQASDHLLQLPAGSPAEEIPVGTVPGPAGASRAGRTAGPHADTGEAADPEQIHTKIEI